MSTMKEKLENLQARVKSDPAVKKQMETDPKGLLEKELGVSLPADTNAESVRKSFPHFFGEVQEGELSDAHLEKVAGGSCATQGCACLWCGH